MLLSAAAISQPLTISTSKLNLVCYNYCMGYVDANPAGGTTPYAYQWSNGETTKKIQSLCAGTYTVTVTDAVNATKTAAVTLTQPAELLYTVTVGTNSATATNVTGGTTPYFYRWSDGQTTSTATGLAPGTYYITVSDKKNCKNVQGAIIN